MGEVLVVGEGGWLLIEMMSVSSLNGIGGIEILKLRFCFCLEVGRGEKVFGIFLLSCLN